MSRFPQAFNFFHDQGYNQNDASELADTEFDARCAGLRFVWMDDPTPWKGAGEKPPQYLGCCCFSPGSNGQALVSVWGVADPSAAECRIAEALLAREAFERFPVLRLGLAPLRSYSA